MPEHARSFNASSSPHRRRSDRIRRTPTSHGGDDVSDFDVVLWEADPVTFQFTYVSRGAEQLLGYPVSDWLADADFWAQHIHADDRAEAVAYCLKATREGRDHEFQYRMVAADGTPRTIRDFVRVQTDEAGAPRRLYGVMIDVTERDAGLQTTDALSGGATPSRILLVEDTSDDADLAQRHIRKAAPSAVILTVSTGSEFDRALWEFAPDVIVSDHGLREGFTGRDALRLARARRPGTPFILLTGSLSEETAVEYMKAGAMDYVLKDRMARLGHVIKSALDRKKQHEEQARAEAQYRDIFLRAPVGIARATVDGRLMAVNPEMARMLGYDATADLATLNIARDVYMNESDRARVLAAAQSGPSTGVEVQWKRKDGTAIWVQLVTQVERDANGVVEHVEVLARDVSEEKRLAAQLRQSQRMEAIGQLAGGVAHDFNNILTVVLAAADLAMSELAPTDKLRDDIEEIRKAAKLGADLTRQLLAFSRQQVLAVHPVDVNDVVRDVERMLRRLLGASVTLKLDLAPDLGPVMADRSQIEQVIMNLVVNARDAIPASEDGMIVIDTGNDEIDSMQAARDSASGPGSYVVLAVSDSGVGMDAETKAKIFEPFFSTKEPGKGTGLGLSTVYGIVKQSGGHITVDSERGVGTTVAVHLPRVTASQAESSAQESSRAAATILLVEDDRVVRTLAERMLAGEGYTVLAAGGGAEALQLARVHPGKIELLITDVAMPEMNGVELAARFKKEHPEVPVLYISGFPAGAFGEQLVRSSDHYLLKPFSAAALRQKVQAILG